MDEYETYLNAERRINEGLIRVERSLSSTPGYGPHPERRLEEMRGFLARLGDPHAGIPAVHVVGTSGKGTVASSIAAILAAAGLEVGLHVSPYVQAMTEKVRLGDRFIAARALAEIADEVLPAAHAMLERDPAASVHGMASAAIAFEAFRRARVDVAVVEAGCGARYDLTSVADTRVAVLTNVGADHLDVLGPDLERVAWHKAGAARAGRPLVTGAAGEPLEVIRREARAAGAELVEIPRATGAFEHNRALAAAAAELFGATVGRPIPRSAVEEGLARARLACRSEIVQEAPRVILDGAHNADKLSVAIEAAISRAAPGPKIAVLGLLAAKASAQLVRPLAGRFDAAFATEPAVYGKRPLPAAETAALLAAVGVEAAVERDPEAALDRAMARAGREGTVVVVGSFYLVGALRERWHAKRDVVLQRSSWTAPRP